MLWVPNFIKIGANFSVRKKFARIYNFGSRSSIPIIIFIISMFDLVWVPNFIKIRYTAILRPKLAKFLISGQKSAISDIIFMINKLDLLWVSNLIALGIHVVFGTKFSWNEGIDACFNVEFVLLMAVTLILLVVTARCQVVTAGYCCSLLGGYCSLPGGYCSLLVVAARYHSLLLVPTFSMNV